MEKKRSPPINSKQKEMLIEFMQAHPLLQSGKFTSTFTFKKAQTMWEELSMILNSVAKGCKKDWRQWRKTWQDIKKNTKAKAAQNNAHARQTGGGEPLILDLDGTDMKVLDIMSPVSVQGLEGVKEPIITFQFNNNTDNVEVNVPDEFSCSELLEMEESLEFETNVADSETNKENNNITTDIKDKVSLSSSTPSGSKLKRGAKKLTKTKRLESSLKLSEKLVHGLDKKSEICEKYYETKRIYLKHRMEYENKKLQTLEKQNNQLEKQNNQLEIIAKILLENGKPNCI